MLGGPPDPNNQMIFRFWKRTAEDVPDVLSRSCAAMNSKAAFWRSPVVDILCIALLVASALKFTEGLELSMDVRSADETVYMNSGRTLPEHGLNSPQYSPLYQIWYFVLSRFVSDPLDLYYQNYRALVCLLPSSLFILLRALGLGRPVGLALSLYVLVSGFPYIWPYPSHFAALILMLGTAAAIRLRHSMNQLICLAAVFFLTAYARPEYFLPFMAVTSLYAAWVVRLYFKDREMLGSTAFKLTLLIAFGSAVIFVFGYPLTGENRQFSTFGQHYSVNRVESTGEKINPWTNWQTILARDFGDAETLKDALKSNPGAVYWHTQRNISRTIGQAGYLLLPNSAFTERPAWNSFLFGTAFLGLVLSAGFQNGHRSRLKSVPLWPLAVVLIGTLMASVPALILIYPRHHYLLPPCLIGLAVGAHLLVRFTPAWRRRLGHGARRQATGPCARSGRACWLRWIWVPAACVAALTLPPRHQGIPDDQGWETLMLMKKTIKSLRSMHIDQSVGLLASEIGIEHYVGEQLTGVNPWERRPDETLSDFLKRNNIGVIVDERQLGLDTRMAHDRNVETLLDEPGQFGFVAREIPGTDRRLLVRHDLSIRK